MCDAKISLCIMIIDWFIRYIGKNSCTIGNMSQICYKGRTKQNYPEANICIVLYFYFIF